MLREQEHTCVTSCIPHRDKDISKPFSWKSQCQLVGLQPKICQNVALSHHQPKKKDLIRSTFPVFKSSHLIFFAGCVFLNDFLIRCLKKLVWTQPIHQREPEDRSHVHLVCFLPTGHYHSDGGAGGAHQDTQSSHLRARQVLHAVRSPQHQEMEDGL